MVLRLTLIFFILSFAFRTSAQDLPPKYPTLELFTNTPCPICGSQNPGLFNRLVDYEGAYHLISFYPGKPYASCIFYQANIPENTARLEFYPQIIGTPRVAINGVQFTSSNGLTTAILDTITGQESWLLVDVNETSGNSRTVDILLEDHVGGSLSAGKLFAVVVEREILYNAPNGETVHHNVFRKFLSATEGDDIDLSSGSASRSYQYTIDGAWQADEVYVVAWLTPSGSKQIINSGTRFDEDFVSGINDPAHATLEIFPNPASSEILITLPADAENASVNFYDVNGRLIATEKAAGVQMHISVGAWPAGEYHAEIRLPAQRLSGRFVISH